MEATAARDVERLLAPLASDQMRLVDSIARPFIDSRGNWPVFDFLDGEFDAADLDAASVLGTLPRDPSGSYAAASWPRSGSNRPTPDAPVSLTVLGMHHSDAMRLEWPDLVPSFLALVRELALFRRNFPRSSAAPRDVAITGQEIEGLKTRLGHGLEGLPMPTLYWLLEREPVTMGAGGSMSVEMWRRGVPRTILRFANVESIEEYVRLTVELLRPMAIPSRPAIPSPLGLVGAVDYLDVVWRLQHDGARLFTFGSAQRIAKLAFPAVSEDDFESRLSGLSEVLRTASVPATPGIKKERDRPLASLEAHMAALRPQSGPRVSRAVATLSAVLSIRDAAHHSLASNRGAAALRELGIGYPPDSWGAAWEAISAKTIDALDALREELASE